MLVMTRGCSSEARGSTGPAKAGEPGGTDGDVASEALGLLVLGDEAIGWSSREGEDETGGLSCEDEETDGVSSRGGRGGEVRP